MKDYSPSVKDALTNTFNSELVKNLTNDDYRNYIEAVCALTLGTLIANEGHKYAAEFCQGALNEKGPLPIVRQVVKTKH